MLFRSCGKRAQLAFCVPFVLVGHVPQLSARTARSEAQVKRIAAKNLRHKRGTIRYQTTRASSSVIPANDEVVVKARFVNTGGLKDTKVTLFQKSDEAAVASSQRGNLPNQHEHRSSTTSLVHPRSVTERIARACYQVAKALPTRAGVQWRGWS
jgi:hypothetical protein